ncbi:MAG: PAS domain S-box protein, partial [Planctomycetes bacterium]|nr:PAS domain S-box protein [Planctomycetota bacterium]
MIATLGQAVAMAIGITTVSILLQFAAATVAFRLFVATRRLMLLPLALAVLLMGVRRSYSLYNKLAFERPIDPGAETIALTISALMLLGLIGLSRLIVTNLTRDDQPPAQRDAKEARGIVVSRLAIMLGAIAIISSCAVGYFAFRASREAIHETIFQGHLNIAQVVAQHANTLPSATSEVIVVEKIRQLWKNLDHPSRNSYVCVVRSDGQLLLHTLRPESEGSDVGDLPIETGRDDGPKTLRALVTSREAWVGDYTSSKGELQVAACAYIPRLDSMVMIYTPAEEIDAAVRASVLPWAAGLSFTTFLLLPLSLGLLYWSSAVSLANRRRAERNLRSSEERLQAILDNTTSVVYVKNLDGQFQFVNRRFEELFSSAKETIVGKTDYDLFPKEQADAFRENDRQVLQRGEAVEFDEVVRHDDGHHDYISIKFSLLDGDGKPYAICSVSTDITDRKRAEEELRLSAEVMKNMAEGVCLLSLDGCFVFTNPRFDEIFGYETGELIGRHPAILNAPGETDPEGTAHEILHELEKSGVWSGDVLNIRKNKKIIWTHSSVSTFEHPQFGNVSVAVVQDITEHKRAENTLKEREQHFRLFSLSTGDCFWNWDMVADTVERSSGLERTFGYLKQEILPGSEWWTERIHPEDKQRVINTFDAAVAGERSVCGYEYRFRRRDDSYADVCDHVCFIRDAAGKVVRSLGAMQDITERKRSEKALHESQALYKSLVEHIPQMIFRKDLDGLVTFASPRFCESLHRSAEEVVGKTDFDFYPRTLAEKYRRDDARVMS